MAGVKVTDLPVLGAADANDVLYIVDTSADQSKQIDVSNLTASLGIDFGVYAPISSATSGAINSIGPAGGNYMVIGDVVICTINGTVDINFASNSIGSATVSLPFVLDGSSAIGTVTIDAPNQFTGYVQNNGDLTFMSLDTSLNGLSILFTAIIQYRKA